MRDKSILLLGGGGFLGRALAQKLVRHGWIVHIVSRSWIETYEDNIIVHHGDMGDPSLLEKVLPQCPIVIHLASATTPSTSVSKPLLEIDTNIIPTLKFLDIFRHYDNERLIFVSSGGTLYGNPETIPVNENQPLCPLSYYGAGKMAIEAFLQAFVNDSKKAVTILRPSNLYGPGQSLRHGFGFIRTLLEHFRMDTEMEIWGDGKIVRDFLYIEDMLKSIKNLIDSAPHRAIYNVGSEKGYSLNAVIQTAEKVCRKPLKVKFLSARQVDVQKVILDCHKIREKTGWQPERSLEEGIRLTWESMHQ